MKGTTMERKYIIAIAATAGTVTAVGTAIAIKKIFFSKKDEGEKEPKKASKTVDVNDTKRLSGVVHTMVAKMDGVELTDEQMFELVSGILFWAKKRDKDTLTGDEVKKAANWVSDKHEWNIEF